MPCLVLSSVITSYFITIYDCFFLNILTTSFSLYVALRFFFLFTALPRARTSIISAKLHLFYLRFS